MKLTIQLKDPDGVYDSIEDAIKQSVAALELSEEEREAVAESRRVIVSEVCATWIEFGEYVSIEIDTETKTAAVLPVKS